MGSAFSCGCCSVTHNLAQMKTEITRKGRYCTDIPFCFLFFCAWVVFFGILAAALHIGARPRYITRGMDWTGDICCTDHLKDYCFAAWPDPVYGFSFRVCVKNCADTETWTGFDQYVSHTYSAYCVPVPNTTMSEAFGSMAANTARAMSDLLTTAPLVLGGAGIALLLSFLYTFMTQKCGFCLVSIMIVGVALCGISSGYFVLADAYKGEQSLAALYIGASATNAQLALGYGIIAATVVYIIIIFALRKQVWLALEVISEGAQAVQDMPLLVGFPMFPFFLGFWYVFIWMVFQVVLFSAADKVPRTVDSLYPVVVDKSIDLYMDDFLNSGYYAGVPNKNYNGNFTTLDFNDNIQLAFAFNFFHLLWTLTFIGYFLYLVIAGAVSEWYFSLRGADGRKLRGPGNKLSYWPVTDSCFRACRFHLGSVAIGSLIIAIIVFLRAFVHYVEYMCQNKPPKQKNKVQECCLRIVSCCLCLAHCCCDKINKNAFVWISIFGCDFFGGSFSAFQLIWNHLVRVAAVYSVGSYLLAVGAFIVALGTTAITALLLSIKYEPDISSLAMPCFVVLIISYMTASYFMAIFEVSIDTIFLCFLVDDEVNGAADGKPMYASDSLLKIVNKYEQESKERAAMMGRTEVTWVSQRRLDSAGVNIPPAS